MKNDDYSQPIYIDESEVDIYRSHPSPEDELIGEESKLIDLISTASTYGLLGTLRIIDSMRFDHSGIRSHIESRIQMAFVS
jgi:hypothetical protein